MRCTFLRPSPFLAPFISYYFAFESDAGEATQEELKVFPSPHAQMTFTWGGESYQQFAADDPELAPQLSVAGYGSSPVRFSSVDPGEDLGLLIVAFQPWGVQSFLDFGIREINNANVPQQDCFGSQVKFVEEQLCEAETLGERVRIVEAFLAGKLRYGEPDREMIGAVGRIASVGGRMPVEELAAEHSLSVRQFNRRFTSTVGIPPKMFSRIVRFQKVFDLMKRGERIDWTQTALEGGFFDQAHFINEFRDFSGMTPGTFLRSVERSHIGKAFDYQREQDDLTILHFV